MNRKRKIFSGPRVYRESCVCLGLFIAIVFCTEIFAVDSEPALVYDKAEKMVAAGDYEGAEVTLKEQLRKDAADYRAMTQLGFLYQYLGEKKKALKYFNDAILLQPDYPPPYFFRGRLYFATLKYDEAIEEFIIFIKKMKQIPSGGLSDINVYINNLHYISGIAADLKHYDAMKVALDEIIRLNPKDQSARYNIGVYYYNGEHNRPKAYQSFTAAIGLDPASAVGKKAKYAIEFMRNNPDSRVAPDFSFIDQ